MSEIDWRREFEEDTQTLFKLILQPNVIPIGDIKAASAILRRWLVEGQINRLSEKGTFVPTLPFPDDEHLLVEAFTDTDISLYSSSFMKFSSQAYNFFYVSNSKSLPDWLPNEGNIAIKSYKISDFLKRKVFLFEGETFTIKEVIKYFANKKGGVHRENSGVEFDKLEKAANFLSIGGNVEDLKSELLAENHVTMEPNSKLIITPIQTLIISIGSSFLNLELNGSRILQQAAS